jgi:hypothetical protein
MPAGGGRAESGDFGLGQHDCRRPERGDRRRPARPENDRDVVLKESGALGDGVRCLPREFAGIGRSSGHTAGA